MHRTLHNLLVGINYEKKQCILNNVAKASVLILSKFDARHLSNQIYSFGLAECAPKVEDGCTLLDALADEGLVRIYDVTSERLEGTRNIFNDNLSGGGNCGLSYFPNNNSGKHDGLLVVAVGSRCFEEVHSDTDDD